VKKWLILHGILFLYSLSSILGKLAAAEPFFSVKFCMLYGGILVILGVYALAWQRILKMIPLTTAFSNKAVTVVWGLIWGVLIFHETVTPGKLMGVLLVVAGVILFSKADKEVEEK